MLPKCPITKKDILCSEDFFGPNLGSIKGKTTRKTPPRLAINTCNDLPLGLQEGHDNVILEVDLMYMNNSIYDDSFKGDTLYYG